MRRLKSTVMTFVTLIGVMTMASNLISREALVDKSEILYQHTASGKIIPWSAVRVCAINNTPAVDAVEVVRCKDCVHAGVIMNPSAAKRFDGAMNCTLCRGDDGYGIYNTSIVYPDDYCSDGVRREGNAVD